MRIRPILFLLLCATGAAAQIPTLTNAANIKFVQGNTIFDRSVADVLALVGAENITVTGNWTFSSNLTQLKDAGTYFYDDATPTKLMRFQLSGITASTTRNLTVQDADGTIALTAAAYGGTGQTAVAQGDLLYGSATDTWSRLAKNTSSTRYLSNTGTSNNPAWAQIDMTNGVTGTLPVANGGTGAATFTNNRLLTGNGTSAIVDEANLTFDGAKLSHTNTTTTGSTYDGAVQTGTLTSNGNSVSTAHTRYTLTSTNSGSVTSNSQYGIYLGHTIPATTQSSNAFGMLAELSNSSVNATGQMTSLFFRTTENENTTTLNNRYGCRGEVLFSGSGDFHTGVGMRAELLNSGSGRWLTGYGLYSAVTNAKTAYGVEIVMTNSRSTANAQRGIRIQNNVSGASVVVDNAYGIELRGDASSSGVITNYYGIYQNTIPAGATNTYFLYGSQSAAHSYLAGTASLGVNSTAAKLTIRGTGTTSSTTPLLVENSGGTDILVITDDQRAAIGTATVSTEKLVVRGATSDDTEKAFVAERSSGTDLLGVRNDGKVSINNAAYTEELTINGQAQLDGVIFTSVTGSTTATGHMVYTDNATHGGYVTIGDGDRQLALMPTMIERHVLDWAVNWTTGRKGAFWTVPARFNGWKISKAYISVTGVGSGAGDDELSIEVGGVVEGVQIVTAGTHTLVMDEVVNTDDVITFNITAISATPAHGLHVALELAKN